MRLIYPLISLPLVITAFWGALPVMAMTDEAVARTAENIECEPQWVPAFGGAASLNSEVQAMTFFDDGSGSGPALYAAGSFTTAGGISMNRIARWNGSNWSALGNGMSGGMLPSVYTLTVFDDGSGRGPALYAGGNFMTADGVTVNRIARWDGSKWSALGSGMNERVTALTVFDDGSGCGPRLYAGGNFTTAGGVIVNRIARWDGSKWSALGSGIDDGGVRALTVFDDGSGSGPALYAGGFFTTADGETVNRIARWDGRNWLALGSGMNGSVSGLTVYDDGSGSGPAMYAGGFFTTADGETVNRIARWDGRNWSALGSGMNGDWVRGLTVFDDGSGSGPALYAGGRFTTAGGVAVNRIARWDGSSWSALGSGMNVWVYALTVLDDGSGSGPVSYAGGNFTTAGGVSADSIARWDGSSWSALGSVNGPVNTLRVFDDGSGSGPALYAAGQFTTAGWVAANSIARWDGSNWSALRSGMDSRVEALTVFDDASGSGPALYAGGEFTVAGGESVNRIARWDGSSWSALDSGMDHPVRALTVFDDGSGSGPALYAAGSFATAGGVTVNRIARWNGSNWSALGNGMTNPVYALTVFDDGSGSGPALYAGGDFFETISGVTVSRIARWDGSNWSALGSGVNGGGVRAMTVFDDGSGSGPALYVGGNFTTAGGVTVNRIARWNGSSWSALGSGANGTVNALTVFDDGNGSGPALYAGGFLSIAGGVTVNRIARWDGGSWSALGSGMSSTVRALAVFDDGSGGAPALYVGGQFTASPAGDSYLAKWQGCAESDVPCPADVNDDDVVDVADLFLLFAAWGACAGCAEDLNDDGAVDVMDLFVMLEAWGACS